jgi:hypothetical protein
LLAAGLVPAQDQPDPGAREQQEPSYEEPSVLSGQNGFGAYARAAGIYDFASIPAASANLSVPEPATGDASYEGPSVLGRDNSSRSQTKRAMNTFGLYAEITGVYDSGLVPVSAEPGQQAASAASYGEEAAFGANVSHRWRRGELNVEYRGAYWQYTNAPAFDSLDQFLQLTYSEALLRHVTLDVKTTLGSTTLASGVFSYFPVETLDRLGLPTDELFNNRTNYIQSRVDLTWRLTQRLSLGFGGDGFVVRRESLLLAGLNGYSARASVAYRLTPLQTIAATYDNTYFDFQNAYGDSRLETAALGYSIALTREWDLSTLAGGVRVDTLGLTEIPVDPSIAALTGQSFAIVTFRGVHYLPVAEARLIRRFRSSSLTLDYASSVTPGNGYYLTSRQTSGAAAYSFIANRSLEARAHAGYNQLSALGQALGKYSNVQGGIQVLYRLTGDAYIDVRYDYRRYAAHYATGDAILENDSNRVSLGVAFRLGDSAPVAW